MNVIRWNSQHATEGAWRDGQIAMQEELLFGRDRQPAHGR